MSDIYAVIDLIQAAHSLAESYQHHELSAERLKKVKPDSCKPSTIEHHERQAERNKQDLISIVKEIQSIGDL